VETGIEPFACSERETQITSKHGKMATWQHVNMKLLNHAFFLNIPQILQLLKYILCLTDFK
jgi:hypothetical protein